MAKRKAPVTGQKAKNILRHGEVMGHALSQKQKGLFGAIAGGNYKGPKKHGRGK